MQKIAVSALCLLLVNCLAAGDVPAAGQDMQFAVQTETLSFEPAARAVVNRLTAHGYAAYFESHSDSDGKVVYKVRFGRFATRAEADAAAVDFQRPHPPAALVDRRLRASDHRGSFVAR